jgi:8-oxo-dGTP pyrophosphatase MutT (NUDIX family)
VSETEEKAVEASTVLLLRDRPHGLEVFMVVRHHEIDSFSGALVFPGGKVDPGDHEARQYCRGAEGMADGALAFRIAALREAFEECGVLLAYPKGSEALVSASQTAGIEQRWRGKLTRDEATIGEVCAVEGLELAVDRLVHYAHWITPKVVPKIFDTHFFLAPAPEDQVALHDGSESTDSAWIRPADALKEGEEGSRTIVFPTRMNLMKLGQWATAAEALAGAAAQPVVTVQPEVTPHPEGRTLRIPAAAGYGGSLFLARQQDGDRMTSIEPLE